MAREWLKETRKLLRLSEVSAIARRYFVLNAFDGCMTTLGLIAGLFIKGIVDPAIILIGGLGTAVAMGLSGGFGAYMTEQAEQAKKIKDIEAAMLANLDNTERTRAEKVGSIFVSVVDALSPMIPSFLMLSPFVAVRFGVLPIFSAYLFSFSTVIITLFLLGAYLSTISEQNLLSNSLKMLLAGGLTAIIILFIGGI
jgi:predicted membrane protein (TIGR00267 family)